MSLVRRSSSVRSAKDEAVPSLSRKSTLTMSNGDVPELKRKSSSRNSLDEGPALKRKQSSVKSVNGPASVPSLKRGGSSKKSSSLVRKGSSVKMPAKRARKPKRVFTFEEKPPPAKKKSKGKAEKRTLLYNTGEYLAIKTDDADFYLCRAQQNVYDTIDTFRIMWLDVVDGEDDVYQKEYGDTTEVECIITNVKLRRAGSGKLRLTPKEKKKIERKIAGDDSSDESEDDEEEEEDESQEDETEEEETEEEEEEEEDVKKKRKSVAKKKVAAKGKKASPKAKKESKAKKEKVKPDKPKRRILTPEQRKNRNLLLVPNTKVKVWNKDPFTESNEKVPFVSTNVYSKLVFRALKTKDYKLLQNLIDDTNKVFSVNVPYSDAVTVTPLKAAVKRNDEKAVNMLLKELNIPTEKRKKKRVFAAKSFIDTAGTGRYNPRSLGVRFVRKVAMSRGSKEGINALTKDLHSYSEASDFCQTCDSDDLFRAIVKPALKSGWSKDKLSALGKSIGADRDSCKSEMESNIYKAVRAGQNKVAGQLIEQLLKDGDSNFNHLHKEVLLFDGEDMRTFREVSVRKKPWDNQQITPVHCAAINPNVKYLSKLLSVLPEYNIMDRQQRRPIHYAVACKGTEPLKYLLQKNVSVGEAEQSGMTELHIACKIGRPHNVEVLLQHAFKESDKGKKSGKDSDDEDDEDDEEDEDEDSGVTAEDKWGKGGINRPIMKSNNPKYSMCPIHLAIRGGNLKCVEILLKYGADVHKPLGPTKDKKTPIHIAAAQGNLDMVKVLYKHSALIEQPDKLKKTPLMEAVMNGHAHVASYLLREGADPNAADTSGNKPLHYAAAYGWYFCVKVLLDAGADSNSTNEWKISPLGISFLKGHIGLTEILLEQPGVDINFRDDSGMTLVNLACKSPLEGDIVEQIDYLVKKQKADVTLTDSEENTPLHYLTSSSINDDNDDDKVDPKKLEKSLKIAEILIKHGCPVDAKNQQGNTALMFAISQNNEEMAKLLIKHGGGEISTDTNDQGQNMLHIFATHCLDYDTTQIINIIVEQSKGGLRKFKEMTKLTDGSGYTPLLRACNVYSQHKAEDVADEDEEEDEDEDDYDDDNQNDKNDSDSDEEEKDPNKKQSRPQFGRNARRWRQWNYHRSEETEETYDQTRRENIEKMTAGTTKSAEKKEDKNKTGRKFIEMLVKTFKANVDDKVSSKKNFEVAPTCQKDWYECFGEAEYSPLHYLVQMDETPVYGTSGEIIQKTPVLDILIDAKPYMQSCNISGETALVVAVNSSNNLQNKAHIVQTLVTASGTEVDYTMLLNGTAKPAALTCAVKKCSEDAVRVLVDYGADVNFQYGSDFLPLHIATGLKRSPASISIVKHLLQGGAHTNERDKDERTPLHTAVNKNVGDSNVTSEMEACLIAAGADSNAEDGSGRTPLHYAFINSKKIQEKSAIDPIEICTTLTASMNRGGLLKKDNLGRTALHWAAYRGAGTCCMHLIQKGLDINMEDNIGNTPIAYAAMNEHESCTFMLMQKNANINVQTYEELTSDVKEESTGIKKQDKKNTYTAEIKWEPVKKFKEDRVVVPFFQVCVEKGWQGVVFVLMDMLRDAGMEYAETVEVALTTRRYNLVLTLLWKAKDNKLLTRVNKDKQTLLHVLALKCKALAFQGIQTRIAEELMSRGVSVSALDKFGCHAAHYAALRHNDVLLKLFMDKDKKLDVNAEDGFGRSLVAASLWAISDRYRYNLNATIDLIKKGAKLDTLCDYPKPAFGAFIGQMIKRRGQHAAFEKQYLQSHKGQCAKLMPLHWAIVHRDFETTKYLLGNNVNKTSSDGMTCLMHAVRSNDIHIVRLLLDHNYEKLTLEAEQEKMKELQKKEDEAKTGKMKKQLSGSRRHFMIKTSSKKKPKRRRVDEEDEDDDDDDDDDEDEEDMDVDEDDEEDADDEEKEESDEDGEGKYDKDRDNAIFTEFLSVKKTSALKLDVTDNDGNTAAHHLLTSLQYGTFENTTMLKILHEAGASLKIKNRRGQTPLDLALEVKAGRIAKGIQTLLEIPEDRWRKPKLDSVVVNYTGPTIKKPNFIADSDALIKKIGDNVTPVDDEKPSPSQHLPYNVEVIYDDELSLYFDILLTKIDVKKRPWGLYNFYKMQVVHQKGKDMYILFTNWGRIGDTGQYQQTPFPTRDEAVKEFKKIFRSKTGNQWKDIESFENHDQKYRLVSKEDRMKGPQLKDLKIDIRGSLKPSKLPIYIQSLMRYWTDKEMIQRSFSNTGIDSELLPFGRVKKETLQAAKAALDKMVPIMEKLDKDLSTNELGDEADELYLQIEQLSTEFYHLVPQNGYSYEKLHPVRDMNDLRRKMGTIHNLFEYSTLAQILAGAQSRFEQMSPVDYIFGAMDCKIRKMEESEVEAQYILKYIYTTQFDRSYNTTKIEALYQVERAGENARLAQCQLDNHRLLFHGTENANLVSILTRGLLLAPVETTLRTGARFGEGIYFADRYSKSLDYSMRSWNEEQGAPNFMLLCEVALGKVQTYLGHGQSDIELEKDYNSLLIVSNEVPDPSMNITVPSGFTVPAGGLVNYPLPDGLGGIADSEYVIFNENQCAVRYIIQLRKDDKDG